MSSRTAGNQDFFTHACDCKINSSGNWLNESSATSPANMAGSQLHGDGKHSQSHNARLPYLFARPICLRMVSPSTDPSSPRTGGPRQYWKPGNPCSMSTEQIRRKYNPGSLQARHSFFRTGTGRGMTATLCYNMTPCGAAASNLSTTLTLLFSRPSPIPPRVVSKAGASLPNYLVNCDSRRR